MFRPLVLQNGLSLWKGIHENLDGELFGREAEDVTGSVVAQLVEQSIQTHEIHRSNPVISKFYFYFQQYCKDDIKEKEVGNGPIFNSHGG